MTLRLTAIVRAFLIVGLLLLSRLADAATITFDSVDVADVTVGEDLWRYIYTVGDASFDANDGFAIFFDSQQYGALIAATPDTARDAFVTTDAEWDILLLDPDPPLQGDGVFDALSLAGAPSNFTFTVDFTWVGAGTPGAQAFNLYRLAEDFSVITIAEGVTEAANPVPEPGALTLLVLGLSGIAGHRWSSARARRLAGRSSV